MHFADGQEVHRAYESRSVDLQARVRVRLREHVRGETGELTERLRIANTTVGRALLFEILPRGLSFDLINQDMTKKAISATINACYRALGLKETVVFAGQLMYTGVHYATRAGVSFGIDDIVIPEQKTRIVTAAAYFREGANVLRCFSSSHGARTGASATALKNATPGYHIRRVVDGAQDLVVTEVDCGPSNVLALSPLVEGGDVVEALGERVLGRVMSGDIVKPGGEEVLIAVGTLLDEPLVRLLETEGGDQIKVRWPTTCQTRYGVCSRCYGRDLARGRPISIGEA